MELELKLTRNILLLLITVFLSGCLSIMEGAGKALDGSAFKEKTISRYKASKNDNIQHDINMILTQNKKGEHYIIISIPDFYMMKLKGIYTEHDNVYNLISVEYLAGSTHGWNEYTVDLLGEAISVSFENEAILGALAFEKIQISKGRIHRYDTRITGNEALTALRNRKDRIAAMVNWMRSIQDTPEKQSFDDFKDYWKPVLFPEMVSKKKRPSNWQQENDVFETADNIRWNKSYTERVFSEELRPVRNSSTMLRDWEEALPWIYMEYHWENIIKLFTNEIIFTKIK